ncbi:fatty acyl-AMP ligase [Nonomuraea deserti]|uniref:Fatty acyl-AMP ligase n=1 Tax=Nonomuraea deserti TaxID=1848322 RepID=A0A4R4V940_9ACTN|nr:fatty acyl-AMP ligase [Nonomuraea deserti]TDD01522.1 fatty acyl-AMP ligase [Nonomuraea deserti]
MTADEPYEDLTRLIQHRAESIPDRVVFRFLDRAGTENDVMTYARLATRSSEVAAALTEVAEPGDRVMIVHDNGPEFFAALFGCLWAGMTGVPAPYRSMAGRGGGRQFERLATILRSAEPAATLTDASVAADLTEAGHLPFGRCLQTSALTGGTVPPVAADPERVAILQYTSGSTSAPKGAMISNRNFVHNLGESSRLLGRADPGHREPTIASWLPLFHDMGLAMGLLALYNAGSCVLMSPMAFLMRPVAWLEAISRYGAVMTAAPNFAYDLCTERVTPDQRADLDLSSMRVALNGAEPVRATTLRRFNDAFGPSGFLPSAMTPCYGLAEATVFVSGLRERLRQPIVLRVDRKALSEGAVRMAAAGPTTGEIVGCGAPAEDLDVRIVDPDTGIQQGEDAVGEIWVSGGSVSSGYWGLPEESAETFGNVTVGSGARYLRTGDLGFLRDGMLFVSGRIKDIIVVDGRNHYPQDIELTVSRCHPAVAAHRCVAFGHVDADDVERLVVVIEIAGGVARGANADVSEIVKAVRREVSAGHDLAVSDVLLVKPGRLPKTTSGKIRRARCRELFSTGAFTEAPTIHE